MRIKGICATRPAIIQLLILSLFLLAGAVLSSIISTGLLLATHGLQADITQDVNLMRLVQFISAICTFLLPAIAMAWTCSDNPCHYLSIKKIKNGRIWILTLVCIFLFSPVINLLGLLNKQMELPAFMAPIEEWMRMQESLAERLTTILLSGDSIEVILANLIVIAFTAGITEEFLFRGALQRVIGRWISNPHTVIWVAAILFSAFHLQFYGFLPRMILGAYFGYLLYWSKSIWIPVFAHFVHNAFAVIGMSDSRLKDNEFITGDIPAEHLLDFCLIAALFFLLFIQANRRLKQLL
ncbi:CPBP family intramembrane glutamic endopeptidase [Parabacteroides sp. ZJ-118]|uniref:CPBP family intramembrane glutamic endopeptidase n=1 Tax=Parabacteroides sp. ZJ-118 TaxID=2709398 RepID=UPI0013EBE94B|nr:CPBP family intramembrane glutamic endopeptidase [Parabacteroides sp. ZJ-118]